MVKQGASNAHTRVRFSVVARLASIKVMHAALTRGNMGRYHGEARPMRYSSILAERWCLVPEVPGSRPGTAAAYGSHHELEAHREMATRKWKIALNSGSCWGGLGSLAPGVWRQRMLNRQHLYARLA